MANKDDLAILLRGNIVEWYEYFSPKLKPNNGSKKILADFSQADLSGLNLQGWDLRKCNFNGCKLKRTRLGHARLSNGQFKGTRFIKADLHDASLRKANLSAAHFKDANLRYANLSLSTVAKATFQDCDIFGASLWGLEGKPVKLKGLRVCSDKRSDPIYGGNVLKIDSLEGANLVYAFSQNMRISEQLDALSDRTVLLLGRFGSHMEILKTIEILLIKNKLVPVIFDFERQKRRDLTETVSALAHLSNFIIANIGDPGSIPHELMRIVPFLPSVPVQPIRLEGRDSWSMFSDIGRYPWVRDEFVFRDFDHLKTEFEKEILKPCLDFAASQRPAP